MKQIKLKAYGKINLGLDIVGRREDGYHEVRMIMQTVGIYDRLYMERVSTDRVSLETNLAYLPTGEGNLVCRAIELLREEFHIRQGVHVRLMRERKNESFAIDADEIVVWNDCYAHLYSLFCNACLFTAI